MCERQKPRFEFVAKKDEPVMVVLDRKTKKYTEVGFHAWREVRNVLEQLEI